jgi:hypothetical protein
MLLRPVSKGAALKDIPDLLEQPHLPSVRDGWAMEGYLSVRTISSPGLVDLAQGLAVATLIIFFLPISGAIVPPLVIAAVLGFILARVMRRLRNWGVP